jgi:hypothetical protein
MNPTTNPLAPATKHSANPLRTNVSPMFSSRETLEEALTYAMGIANASGNPAAVVTAIMVVLNTAADIVEPAFTSPQA